MTWIVMALVMVGGALVQAVLPAPAWLGQPKWPILLGIVLYYALNRSTGVAVTSAILAGLLRDVLSFSPLGHAVIFYVLLAWLLGRFRGLLMGDAAVTAIFVGVATAALSTLILGLLLRGAGHTECPLVWMAVRVVGTALLGGVSTPVVFCVVGGLDRLVGNVEVKSYVGEIR